MKIVSVATFIFILLIIFCIMFHLYLNDIVENLTLYTEKMIEKFEENKSAEKEYSLLKKEWKKSEIIIGLQIEHAEIDSINEIISELEGILYLKNEEDFYQSAFKLKHFIKHIYDKNSINMETIL